MDPSSAKKGKRKRGRRGRLHQKFTSYISFGIYSTLCSGFFCLAYFLLLVGLMPLLQSGDDSAANVVPTENGHLRALKVNDYEKEVMGNMANTLRKRVDSFKNFHGITDKKLIDSALSDFKRVRDKDPAKKKLGAQNAVVADPNPPAPGRRAGYIVLGMHRSGTSMLSGLLVQGSGYNVGGPLIGAHFDNQKGFFERIDAVLQNDEFLKSQRMWWSSGIRVYDSDNAAAALRAGNIQFVEGTKAVAFMNSPDSVPWLQKDPRMCITLKTWLGVLSSEPAVLFTYRHPHEVALSLVHREKFELEHGLRLWIIYNTRAVQNSQKLCRVLSSNDDVLANPLGEVLRITEELTTKCGVPPPPKTITQEDIDIFIDPNMQHGKKEMGAGRATLEDYNGCIIPDFDSVNKPGSQEHNRESALYMVAMKIHCDFKNGKAYEDNYEWPQIPG